MKRVRSDWERALLVCGKCSRKLGGGFGRKGKTPLARALRRELGAGKGRKATLAVAEVKCLGVCPKGAVTLVDTADLGRWRLVRPGDELAVLAEARRDPIPPLYLSSVIPGLTRGPASSCDEEARPRLEAGVTKMRPGMAG